MCVHANVFVSIRKNWGVKTNQLSRPCPPAPQFYLRVSCWSEHLLVGLSLLLMTELALRQLEFSKEG